MMAYESVNLPVELFSLTVARQGSGQNKCIQDETAPSVSVVGVQGMAHCNETILPIYLCPCEMSFSQSEAVFSDITCSRL